jgi:UDP-N-acetylmuramate dehydrogenase
VIPASLVQALQAIEGLAVRRNEPMARHSVWRVGGPVALWLCGEVEAALLQAGKVLRQASIRIKPLDGREVLVRDGGFEGVLARAGGCALGLERRERSVRVGCWVQAARLAAWAEREGLGGLEHLCASAGTVGEAIRSGRLVPAGLRVVKGTRAGDIEPSALSEHHLMLHAELELSPRIGRAKPSTHRPGRLFEPTRRAPVEELLAEAQLPGVRLRAARIGQLEPNSLNNLGGATASDLLRLGKMAHDRVKAQSGVDLTTAIKPLGRNPGTGRKR